MKAEFTNNNVQNGKNLSGDKETIATLTVVAYKNGEFFEPVRVSWYMGRSNNASMVYCSIWCHSRHRDISVAGIGSAGGYGYHKPSAAFQEALDSAGIKLSGDQYGREKHNKPSRVDGCGDSAVDRACMAIVKALGFKKFYVVRD